MGVYSGTLGTVLRDVNPFSPSLPFMPKDDQACQAQACDLQACLNKNTYNPERCDAQMFKLYECCAKMYDSKGKDAESTACPIESVTRRWLKNHPKQ
ncbi:DUF1903-domain-containing protein [Exidia glandulosa HHB12029]|uniref:Cx9C motif-containing protein 4, mitochondrial n=1 Tax=Exidia glandulosa HHB12029 TaxID=1314781 RepID=A0A165CQ24_EXIGL|nr:DUF1903-domain-containing protein [Exidia glandulosa HHB12029]